MFLLNWLNCALSFAASSVLNSDRTHSEDRPEQDALIERARYADPGALAALYDQYVDKIYSYIYHRVNNAQLAEDLTGQAFVRMLEAVKTGRTWQTSFSGWLYRIAHNLVIDHYRRRERASFVDLDETIPIQTQDCDPARSIETRLDKERLHAALARLTEEQAQVIVLRFQDELSIAEAAEVMGKTDGAIKALQYRAVLALKRVMRS